MSQISNLYRLQQIDSQLDSATAQMDAITKGLIDNSTIIEAQVNVTQAEEFHQIVSKTLRDAENKSYDARIKTELAEKSLYSGKIQNPKELQELQAEIASLKKLIIALEDKQLTAMMQMEEAESKLMWANEELRTVQKNLIERNSKLEGEKTKVLQQIERLEAERKAMLPTIPAPDLGLYEQLRKARNGVAVIKILSKSCSACGTTLTAAVVQATQAPGLLTRCPTCGRILYSG